ncbi:hypothetical protein ACFFGT_05430 [Mucilaginibacter angelicae]|uniref:Uncharacterized protein n=1 Tax=Mucilaginibacter angelicae TaxID=869718 RepID=A0ABV6L1L9_9SPHI
MKILILTGFILLCNCACAQEYGAATNATERKVLRLINALPEVQRENKFRKAHKNPHLLKALIQSTPTKEKNYYEVSISEDLGFQLRTYEWYEVDAKTFAIRYWDIASDKTMSLREKRRLQRSQ